MKQKNTKSFFIKISAGKTKLLKIARHLQHSFADEAVISELKKAILQNQDFFRNLLIFSKNFDIKIVRF